MFIESLEDAVFAFTDPEPALFGVRFVVDAVGTDVASGVEIAMPTTGMFSLREGAASFRVRMDVQTDLFREFWIDVATVFSAPEDYMVKTDVFLHFANQVALPQLRNYAQSLADPLLIGAGYPPRFFPSVAELGTNVFRGEELPSVLGPGVMGQLHENPNLVIPELLPPKH
ncbi:MAG: hypothetical protein WAS54_10660 [Scrofimicrobium sp.]